jgi:hypothetical protein
MKKPRRGGAFPDGVAKRYFVTVVDWVFVVVSLDGVVVVVVLLTSTDGGLDVSAGFASIVVVDEELAGGVGFEAVTVVVLDAGGVVLAFFSTVVDEVCVRSHAVMPKAATTARASAGMTCFIGSSPVYTGGCADPFETTVPAQISR